MVFTCATTLLVLFGVWVALWRCEHHMLNRMPFFAPRFLVFVGREVLGARPGAAWVPGYFCVGGKVCVVRVVCMNAHGQPEAVMNAPRSHNNHTKVTHTCKHEHTKSARSAPQHAKRAQKLPAGSPHTCKRYLPAGASHTRVGLNTHLDKGEQLAHTHTHLPAGNS